MNGQKIIQIASVLLIAAITGCTKTGPVQPAGTVETSSAEIPVSSPMAAPVGTEAPPAVATTEPITPTIEGCELMLPGPQDMSVVLCETYEDNRHNWQVESQDNPYARYTSEIRSGKFIVEYSAKVFGGFQRTALTWFDIGKAKYFALSVSGQMETRFEGVSWGVAFRADETRDSYFLFSIYNDGTYGFEIFENNKWIQLISRRPYSGIHVGESNTMDIVVYGGDFIFTINGEQVNIFSGGLLEGEEILLMVGVKEGASAVFSFDDIVLQS